MYKISFLKESTYGSNTIGANTQTYKLGLFTQENTLPAPVSTYNTYYKDGKRDVQSAIQNKVSFDGELSFIPCDVVMAKYALGQDSFTDKGDYNEHIITGIDTGNLPSFTLHFEYSDNWVKDFFGCKVDKYTLIMNENMPLICAMKLKANNMQTGTKLTTAPTFINSDNIFKFHDDITFQFNNTTYHIRHFSVFVDNQLNPVYVYRDSNQELPKYLFEQNRLVGFEFSLYYDDDTFIDEVLTASARKLTFKINRSTHDFIFIELENSYIKSAPIKLPAPGELHETFVFGLSKTLKLTIEDTIGDYDGY